MRILSAVVGVALLCWWAAVSVADGVDPVEADAFPFFVEADSGASPEAEAAESDPAELELIEPDPADPEPVVLEAADSGFPAPEPVAPTTPSTNSTVNQSPVNQSPVNQSPVNQSAASQSAVVEPVVEESVVERPMPKDSVAEELMNEEREIEEAAIAEPAAAESLSDDSVVPEFTPDDNATPALQTQEAATAQPLAPATAPRSLIGESPPKSPAPWTAPMPRRPTMTAAPRRAVSAEKLIQERAAREAEARIRRLETRNAFGISAQRPTTYTDGYAVPSQARRGTWQNPSSRQW